jgi:acyl-coenzyme A synthetase/AMP-(fatty) acid ligase
MARLMSIYPDLAKYALRNAAIAAGEAITYGELEVICRQFAGVIKRRSLAFVLCENSIGSLAGCTALLNNHVVPLLLDAGLDRQLLGSLLETYRPSYLYLPSRLCHEFPRYNTCLELQGYVLLFTGHGKEATLHEDLALLLTTSGSTGSPKLVRLSYDNVRANGESIIRYLGINQDERPITTLPMHYSYGFSIINSHLMAGATLLMTTHTVVERGFWDFFREQGATSFGGVPYTFEMLKRLHFFRMELPSLKTITQAGGRLAPELAREFAEYATGRGIRFFIMYGQTEATARMSYLPPEHALEKCGSVGVAIPGGDFFLTDENGIIIKEPEVEGELCYRGRNVSLGYAECREDLARGDERAGVLCTGDMARWDSDGYYYITGRKKRFIKLFGNRVNLDEAEQMVRSLTPECACCGTDDHMQIFITEEGMEQAVSQHISATTGIHHSAFQVMAIAAIPKNESGKTLYGALPGSNV